MGEDVSDTNSFITITQGMSGHFAVLMWWNNELDEGFWEPYQTGIGRYKTRDEAIKEAKTWAEAEELEFLKNMK